MGNEDNPKIETLDPGENFETGLRSFGRRQVFRNTWCWFQAFLITYLEFYNFTGK